MMKNVMMEMTMMVMDVHQIVMLKKDGIVLMKAQQIKISAICVRLCLSPTQIKLNEKLNHKTLLLATLFFYWPSYSSFHQLCLTLLST